MKKLRLLMIISALAGLVGCGGAEPASGTDGALDPLVFTFGPYSIAPGEELDFCEYFELPGDDTSYVTGLSQENGGVTHHAFLYRTQLDHAAGRDACPNAVQKLIDSRPIYASTAGQGPTEMPDGVAMILDAHQRMFLNIHLLNPSMSPVETSVTLKLDRGDPARPWTPVGFFEFTTFEIDVPAHGEADAGNECGFGRDVSVISMTSHSHLRTVAVTANLWDGMAAGEEVYRSTNWAEPVVTSYPEPLDIPYTKGLSFKCAYKNPDAYPVGFGDTADDEMCYLLGYYFPGPDTLICGI